MKHCLQHITFKKLQFLSAIADKPTYKQAAQSLKLAPNKMWRELRQIEYLLDMGEIFVRDQDHVELTDLGDRLLYMAGRMHRVIKNNNVYADTPHQHTLKISSTAEFSYYILPPAIKQYLNHYPLAKISLQQYHPNHIPNVYESDIVIGHTLETENDVTYHYLETFSYKLFASPIYIKKYGCPQNLKELEQHRHIVYQYLGTQEKKKNIVLKCDSYFHLNEAVLSGIGIGFMSLFNIKNVCRYSSLVNILPDFPTTHIDLKFKYLKTNPKIEYIKYFLNICDKYVRHKKEIFGIK